MQSKNLPPQRPRQAQNHERNCAHRSRYPASNGLQMHNEPIRIVFIGPSIRSAWQNPAAHIHRAVMTALNLRDTADLPRSEAKPGG